MLRSQPRWILFRFIQVRELSRQTVTPSLIPKGHTPPTAWPISVSASSPFTFQIAIMSSRTHCQSSNFFASLKMSFYALSTALNVKLKISEVKNPCPLMQQAALLYARKCATNSPYNIRRNGKLMVCRKQPVKIQGLNFLDGLIKKMRVCGGIKSIEASTIEVVN